MKRLLLLLFFIIACSQESLSAFAEEEGDGNVIKLEEIVVTATHKMKVIDTPASISIITAKDLEEMGAKNISEVLKKIPGVIDKSAKDDAIAIRGTQSSMAGGPVILIDGVPQKIGDYRYDQFDFIPVSQIERIEVLRFAGIVYGPGSARGVINVITRDGKGDKFRGEVKASYGSWETYDAYATISGGLDRWDYFVNAAYFNTGGYEEEKQDRSSALLKLGYNLSDQTRIGIRGNLIRNEHHTAYGLWKKKWQMEHYRRNIHFPKSETDPTLVWHSEMEQDISTIALEFCRKDEELFLNSTASWTGYDEDYRDMHEKFTNPKNVSFDNKNQDLYTFTISGGYNFDFGRLGYTPSFGINFEEINFDQERLYPNDPGKNTDKYNFDIDERQYGLFWDNDLLFGQNWGLKIGGRVDRAELKFEDKVPTRVDQDETLYGWSVAPSYHFSDRASVYVSAGRNFWFPTPRYYAWAAERGDDVNRPEDLKPEEALTYELGYRHRLQEAHNLAITGFITEYRDRFTDIYDDTGAWKGMKNIGEARYRGVELETDGRLASWLGYRLAGDYLSAKWTRGSMEVYEHPTNVRKIYDLDGKYIIGVPRYSCMIGIDFFLLEKFKVSLDYHWSDKSYVDYLNRVEQGATTTVDFNVSYKMDEWKFWVLGKNIFGEEIERVINPTGRLTGANGEYDSAYYVQGGRYLEVGVSYKF